MTHYQYLESFSQRLKDWETLDKNCQEEMLDEDLHFTKYLNNDLYQSNILVISGGPGFYSEQLQKKYKANVIVSEFLPEICQLKNDQLGLSTVHIDLQKIKESFAQLKDNSFDIVLMYYSSYYASDLGELASEIRRVTQQNGKIYIEQTYPNRAAFVKFQFDNYPPLTLWSESYTGNACTGV